MAINENDDFFQAGGVLDPLKPVKFYDTVNLAGRIEINPVATNNGSKSFLELAGTLPTNAITSLAGSHLSITSAGTANFTQTGQEIDLLPGYTGSAFNVGLIVTNGTLATGTGIYSNPSAAIYGGGGGADSPGTHIGLFGEAFAGNINAGTTGFAIFGKDNSSNIGCYGSGANNGANGILIGGHFGLHGSATPTFESAALCADNAGTTKPIVLWRDNGVAVLSLEDGGSEQGKMGTKTLTEGAATGFVQISVPIGTTVGGFIKYTIEANDGVDFQARSGILPFAAVNKGGTETGVVATVSTATETVAVSAGTLTNAFDVDTTPTNAINIRANATSSLAQTVLRISYRVEMYSNAVVTVTPL